MAVTVGTDVYDTVANTDAYWVDRNNTDWAALTEAVKEVNMRKATDWIDRSFRFVGTRATETQRLAWPRTGAYDNDGYLIASDEIPRQVEEAMYIMADLYRSGTYDFSGILTDDAAVERQKVDVIEIEYDVSAKLRTGDVPTHVYELLTGLITNNILLRT